ncbi:hypothetical protein F0562_019258 [Nyssa sinensis]|uniref:Uncharacterized protein n=1 Tax=Nyssa sinensis TaxID=561372 RepID=A0A5J4ZDQ8_9ASTE|nr:hypothetical protein F0562_019258 [Nyssa sinensis]
MKDNPKNSQSQLWDQTLRNSSPSIRTLVKRIVYFIVFISLTYMFYSLKFTYSSHDSCSTLSHDQHQSSSQVTQKAIIPSGSTQNQTDKHKTELRHIVFGIAASADLWENRKDYTKVWWRPNEMRGFVWLDNPVKNGSDDDNSLPPLKLSSETSNFRYTNRKGSRSAIRLSRIVSETVRLGMEDVRWFVMGDDDTVFIEENLVRVLRKYDHNQFYYIGSSSESHLQNVYFSYNMAYGGGGFAISYPLAKALEKMQDRCIQRYPSLYGSDDRIHACMAELGVPLTKEIGFHQYDVYGNLFGLLTAHPIAPLVSFHHLDLVEPIFPNMDRIQALQRLKLPMKLDSAALMQQSICYDTSRKWTISVSWGYSAQIFRGIFPAREMEIPTRTFLNWYKRADYTGYDWNTRPVSRHPCQMPFVYMLSNALYNSSTSQTASEYILYPTPHQACNWRMADPSQIQRVEVFRKPDPFLWDKPPRRNCCRILPSEKEGTIVIDVGACREGEVIELQ